MLNLFSFLIECFHPNPFCLHVYYSFTVVIYIFDQWNIPSLFSLSLFFILLFYITRYRHETYQFKDSFHHYDIRVILSKYQNITSDQNIYIVQNNFENEKGLQAHNEKYKKCFSQFTINRPHARVIFVDVCLTVIYNSRRIQDHNSIKQQTAVTTVVVNSNDKLWNSNCNT